MTSRSQSFTTPLLASLVAVVAVNSAVRLRGWYQEQQQTKQLESDKAEQQKRKQQMAMRSKARGARGTNNSSAKKVSNIRPSSAVKVKREAPEVAARKVGKALFKSQPQKNASTTKPKPRVRKSLLPWNDEKETTVVQHTPVVKQSQIEVEQDIVVERPTVRRVARVRESLLPWNSTDKGPVAHSVTPKKPSRKMHVRDSLLPESIRPTTVTVRGNVGKENPSLTFSSILADIDDSSVTTRSSTGSSIKSRTKYVVDQPVAAPIPSTEHVPLKNMSNVNTSRRRKSREMKEAGWKRSAEPKAMLKQTIKSPTLVKLSSRQDDCDVRSLRSVFEHQTGSA